MPTRPRSNPPVSCAPPLKTSRIPRALGFRAIASRPHSGLRDAHEVARGVAERAVARAPRLGRRLLEYLGARGPDLLERGVEIVGAEDRSLQRALRHERQEGVALDLRKAAVRLEQDDVDVLPWGTDGDPAEALGRDVVA